MNGDEKIIELTRNYWNSRNNCAQSTACGILDYNDYTHLSEYFRKAFRPYGGGLGELDLCGAILGTVAGMGLVLADKKGLTDKEVLKKVSDFKDEIKEQYGTLICAELMQDFIHDGKFEINMPGRREKCTDVVELSVALARQIIDSS